MSHFEVSLLEFCCSVDSTILWWTPLFYGSAGGAERVERMGERLRVRER